MRAKANWWQYSRWVSNIGRSLRINPPSASERNVVESFIQRMVNPDTGTRPWLAEQIRLICNNLVSGNESISPLQPDYVEAKIIVIIGRDLMKIPVTTIEKPYCDELIGATGNRKYREDNQNLGTIIAEWFDNFELGNFDKWTTVTGNPEIIQDPDNVVNNLADMNAGDELFKDWGQEFVLNNYGRATLVPMSTENHEFRFVARNSSIGITFVLKDGGFYYMSGMTQDLIPFVSTKNYEAGRAYILEIKNLVYGSYDLYVNGNFEGTIPYQMFGNQESSIKFSAVEGETRFDEIFVYQN